MKWTLSYLMLLVGVAIGPVGAEHSPLEQLDTATALSDVRASRGVVFVDLYADW